MPGPKITQKQKAIVLAARGRGETLKDAADEAGISLGSAWNIEHSSPETMNTIETLKRETLSMNIAIHQEAGRRLGRMMLDDKLSTAETLEVFSKSGAQAARIARLIEPYQVEVSGEIKHVGPEELLERRRELLGRLINITPEPEKDTG